jgi:ribonuclease VapC
VILDSSALIAVFLREEAWPEVMEHIENQPLTGVGTPTLVETGMVLTSVTRANAGAKLAKLLEELGIGVIPFQSAHWPLAVDAFDRYGKGRHQAALNFGDCLTYAIAKHSGRPLLAFGDDFPLTDLVLI